MAKNPSATPKDETKIKVHPAGAKNFELAEFRSPHFFVTIPHSDKLEDILKPEYWANHATNGKVQPRALMTCIDEHLRWEASLRVLQRGPTFLRVALIHHVEYDVAVRGDAEIESLRVKYRVEARGQNGWRVVDPNNNELISGLTDEKEANAYLDKHLGTLNQKVAA